MLTNDPRNEIWSLTRRKHSASAPPCKTCNFHIFTTLLWLLNSALETGVDASPWSFSRQVWDASSIGYWWVLAHCSSRHWINSSRLSLFFLCFLFGHNSQKGLGPMVHKKLVCWPGWCWCGRWCAGLLLLLLADLNSASLILSTLQ